MHFKLFRTFLVTSLLCGYAVAFLVEWKDIKAGEFYAVRRDSFTTMGEAAYAHRLISRDHGWYLVVPIANAPSDPKKKYVRCSVISPYLDSYDPLAKPLSHFGIPENPDEPTAKISLRTDLVRKDMMHDPSLYFRFLRRQTAVPEEKFFDLRRHAYYKSLPIPENTFLSPSEIIPGNIYAARTGSFKEGEGTFAHDLPGMNSDWLPVVPVEHPSTEGHPWVRVMIISVNLDGLDFLAQRLPFCGLPAPGDPNLRISMRTDLVRADQLRNARFTFLQGKTAIPPKRFVIIKNLAKQYDDSGKLREPSHQTKWQDLHRQSPSPQPHEPYHGQPHQASGSGQRAAGY